MYHNIAKNANFNTVSATCFNEQLSFIRDHGYQSLSFHEYVRCVRNNCLPKRAITLTFDDAYRSYFEIAIPLLEEYRMHSALFVPTGHVGRKNSWDSDRTNMIFPILSWEELYVLSKHPLVTLGSHSVTHRRMKSLSEESQEYEIYQSKKEMEERLGTEINYFSYPFGQYRDFNRLTIKILKRTGYTAACSTLWQLSNTYKDIYKLNRIEVNQSDNLKNFINKLTNPWHRKYFYRLAKGLLYGW